MIKDQAIFNLYPSAVTVGNEGEFVLDKDQNPITIDEKKVEEEYKRLKADYDAQAYARSRKDKYPTTDDLIVALWEKVIEGRSESADALEVKRQEIKTAHPKSE